MKDFEPMLAAKDASRITFPAYVSPKIDGVRAVVRGGRVLSRKLLPIPNLFVQSLFGRPEYEGLDGELVVGLPVDLPDDKVMQRTMSGVMSVAGEPDVTFYAFDVWDRPEVPFAERIQALYERVECFPNERLLGLPQAMAETQEALDAMELEALASGFEGVMVRGPLSPYKYGRATAREGFLTKVKRFVDEEAVVVGYHERMHNDNEAGKDELGRTKRSTHKDNKRPAGDLGALECQVLRNGSAVTFSVGAGFSARDRKSLWLQRETLIGKVLTIKHFAAAGVKLAPRFPVFKCFRDPRDC